MDYEAILLDVKDRVATITLNRPERMNAWNNQMASELGLAMQACNDDDEVRAIVLTGTGRALAFAPLSNSSRRHLYRAIFASIHGRPSICAISRSISSCRVKTHSHFQITKTNDI